MNYKFAAFLTTFSFLISASSDPEYILVKLETEDDDLPNRVSKVIPNPDLRQYVQGGPKVTPHLIFRGQLRVCSLAGKLR